jgi:16S rRNA (uracil1498-N3)-methyltransferase
VLTQNTEVRRINEERMRAQIIEAAEQCERLSLPLLTPPAELAAALAGWDRVVPLYACLERADARPLAGPFPPKTGFLVGPEGGFTEGEKQQVKDLPYIVPVSLGTDILRAETAALFCLSGRRLFNIL